MSEHKGAKAALAAFRAGKVDVFYFIHANAIASYVSDLEARLEKAREVIEPFAMEGWADEHGWTDLGCPRDRVCDWFGPSAFRSARAWMEQNDASALKSQS